MNALFDASGHRGNDWRGRLRRPRGTRFGVSETKAIRQRTSDFAAAFNAKDTDKVLSFYSSEIVFMPPNSPILRGKDALRKFYDDLYGEGATELRMGIRRCRRAWNARLRERDVLD